MSARQLAAYLAISPRSIGRFVSAGVLERERNGQFDLQRSVQAIVKHFMLREHWAFQQLRRFRIFDELTGDVFEPRRYR